MKRNSLTINAVLNIIKQAFSILFPLITFPYASRVLGVSNYGKINFSSSIISYIALVAGLGIYNYAIREGSRIRENKKDLKSLADEVFSINIVSTIVAYMIMFVLVIFWPKLEGYKGILIIQSLSIIFTTIGIDWFNVIFEDYFFIAIRYIICQSIAIILMFLLVREEGDYMQYAFTSIFSSILANISNLFYIKKHYHYFPKFRISSKCLKHIRAIMIMFGSSVATLIYVNSDVTILGILKDDTVVGYYSVSSRIYSIVKQLLNALLVVSIPRLSNELANGEMSIVNKQYNKVFSTLLLIVGPACIGMFMLSENIILLFSGEQYLPAVGSLKILSVALVFATLACFFVNVVMIPMRKEKAVLIATCVSAIVNIVLNFVLIPVFSQNAAALTTVIAEIIMLISSIYFCRGIVHLKFRRELFTAGFSSLLIGIICSVCNMYLSSNLIIIIISVCLSIMVWLLCIWIFMPQMKKEILQIMKKLKNNI